MEQAERLALGMVDAERKRRQNVKGAEVLEIDGLVLAFSNLADPALNSIVVEHEPADPPAAMAEAETEFVRRGQPIGIELQLGREPRLEEAVHAMGLTRIIERPGFAATLDELADAPTPEGIAIRAVTDEAGARALVEVGVQAFGDDPEIGMAFYGAGAFGVEGVRTFVAWEGDQPVGMSAGYVRDGAVGVMGVAVVPAARRRGVGAAVTVWAARSFPDTDLAWLHPSDQARSMYEGLGFKRVADYEIWVRASS